MRILYLLNQYSQQRQHEKKRWIYPVLMAMEAQWYRKQGHEVIWAMKYPSVDTEAGGLLFQRYDKIIEESEGLPFLTLPRPDRVFTNAMDKRYQQNGNFKYLPGTYIQSASGCWHGKCTFCVENKQKYEVRPVDDVIEEIKECKALGFKEVFDDSATFPKSYWLDSFLDACYKSISGVSLGCNMRLDGLANANVKRMRKCGFRMVLVGVESANQATLTKIQKGVKVEKIIPTIKKASEAGLEPHVAVMFGYPWESDDDALNTLRLVHYLLRKGYAKTAQASFYQGPGTASNKDHRRFIKRIYGVAKYPEFWFRKISDCRTISDLKYLWRQIKNGLNQGK